MPEESVVMQCGHCGNTTAFEVVATGGYPNPGELRIPGDSVMQWRILRCPVCERPSLDQVLMFVGNNRSMGAEVHSAPAELLYPSRTALPNLPERVDKAFRAALSVRHEPIAFAVTVGRTLEVVCNHEQATGNNLSQKLSNLAASGRIPHRLAEMGQQLRQIRNLAAHDAEDEVTEDDVPVILDFVEAILEYLYVAPAKIAAVQTRLQRNSGKS